MAKRCKQQPPWGLLSFIVNVVRLVQIWHWPHD
jgi:hypothetical protein